MDTEQIINDTGREMSEILIAETIETTGESAMLLFW